VLRRDDLEDLFDGSAARVIDGSANRIIARTRHQRAPIAVICCSPPMCIGEAPAPLLEAEIVIHLVQRFAEAARDPLRVTRQSADSLRR